MDDTQIIRLEVQGLLVHRDVVLRTVSSACRLVTHQEKGEEEQNFRAHVVSAVGEAFNNIALHAYKGGAIGVVQIRMEVAKDWICIEFADFGRSFDPRTVPAPDLDALPESGLGLFIIKSFMDGVDYQSGHPNVLRLTKRVR